jgi:pyruvate/2-oxoacid:ferredoxin oxidoreductase alpha subunit
MACRQTGWAMLASNNVQEVMTSPSTLPAPRPSSPRVPFLHFFDGFPHTQHEVPEDRGSALTTSCSRWSTPRLVRQPTARRGP